MIKVIDFGLAKAAATGGSESDITHGRFGSHPTSLAIIGLTSLQDAAARHEKLGVNSFRRGLSLCAMTISWA
jgi:hypothetical protein